MKRLDVLLVDKGLAKSRAQAQMYIKNGQVYVNNERAEKPSIQTDEFASVEIRGEVQKYVSRGGYKLEAALERFNIDLKDNTCIDVGASTGGFTDCMLQHGARKVYAIDVGHEQLDEKILADSRVVNMEKTNIKDVHTKDLEKIDFIAIDASFVSLTNIIEHIKSLLGDDGEIVALIKPQFEVGKGNLNKKGIVKDEKIRKKAVDEILRFINEQGMCVQGIIESPIRGGDGNTEYLVYVRNQE